MNWTLYRARKDGSMVFGKDEGDDLRYYKISDGSTGTCSQKNKRQALSFVMALNEDDNRMVEDAFNES